MSELSLEDAIAFAIKRERDSIELYSGLLDRTESEANRATLIEIIEMEKKHIKSLSNFNKENFSSVTSTEEILSIEIDDEDRNINLSNMKDSFRDTLVIAIKEEESSYKLYEKMANYYKDRESIRSFFSILANAEKYHKKAIEQMYEESKIFL